MLIDFEGVEGSGASELSRAVARRLAARGWSLQHVGSARRPSAGASAALGGGAAGARNAFQLQLAELNRQVEQTLKPALQRGLCVTDGHLAGIWARALSRNLPWSSLELAGLEACKGAEADVVVLVDVEPELARARCEAARWAGEDSGESPPNRGLDVSLAATQEAFLRLAEEAPGRWLVVRSHQDDSPQSLEEQVVELLIDRIEGRDGQVRRVNLAERSQVGQRKMGGEGSLAKRFFTALDRLALHEPQVALWLLRGVGGPYAHQRRLNLLERHAPAVALSLQGLTDEDSASLRGLLAELAPGAVAASLVGLRDPGSWALRTRLAEAHLGSVVAALAGLRDEPAWALREQALARGLIPEVLQSLAGLDGPLAWSIRTSRLALDHPRSLALSLEGVAGVEADLWRARLEETVPEAVLQSLTGVESSFARRMREAWLPHAAGLVMASARRVSAPHADRLRARVAAQDPMGVDAAVGLDSPEAWALRESAWARWPAAVARSLAGCADGERVRELAARLEGLTDSLVVLAPLYALEARRQLAALPPRNAWVDEPEERLEPECGLTS